MQVFGMFYIGKEEKQMKISIAPPASQWFRDELSLEEGDSVRFLGKVYGKTEVHEGFSVGISIESPKMPLAEAMDEGITYFTEKQDDWFFNGYDLEVDYDAEQGEPIYHFVKN